MGGIARIQVTETEAIGDRRRVQLEVKAEPMTPAADSDESSPTPMPADAYVHKVLYRLEGNRMVRELLTYPDEARISRDCWMLSPAET